MANLEEIRKSFEEGLIKLDELIEHLKSERDRLKAEIEGKLSELEKLNFIPEELEFFLEEPYLILPRKKNEFYVIVPKFVNFHIGWLDRQTKSYNIFIVNRYTQWLEPLPEDLRKRLQFPEVPPFKVVDGYFVTGEEHRDTAWKRYRKYLSRREGEDRLKIKKGYEFELIAKLIEDGVLPFIPHPVDEADLREWSRITLRDYQEYAWNEFLGKGAIGIFWGFGAGKSLFGIYALARIRGRKLVVVPTKTLIEQWRDRIVRYIPEYIHEIELITYHSYHKVASREYTLVIFDEVHHLPADTFIRLSTIKAKYRIGLSASPFREDGRESYIFALTGFPVGTSWSELLSKKVIMEPAFRVYIVKNQNEKLKKLGELLKIPSKTIIFCDSIELGKRISKRFKIPFVYSETKDRLKVIRESQVCVVSRVGDEGISFPDIERVIEVAFLAGSRMQESQRFGRLMHSQQREPEHVILMTDEEFRRYNKRLYAITERGFRIEVMR